MLVYARTTRAAEAWAEHVFIAFGESRHRGTDGLPASQEPYLAAPSTLANCRMEHADGVNPLNSVANTRLASAGAAQFSSWIIPAAAVQSSLGGCKPDDTEPETHEYPSNEGFGGDGGNAGGVGASAPSALHSHVWDGLCRLLASSPLVGAGPGFCHYAPAIISAMCRSHKEDNKGVVHVGGAPDSSWIVFAVQDYHGDASRKLCKGAIRLLLVVAPPHWDSSEVYCDCGMALSERHKIAFGSTSRAQAEEEMARKAGESSRCEHVIGFIGAVQAARAAAFGADGVPQSLLLVSRLVRAYNPPRLGYSSLVMDGMAVVAVRHHMGVYKCPLCHMEGCQHCVKAGLVLPSGVLPDVAGAGAAAGAAPPPMKIDPKGLFQGGPRPLENALAALAGDPIAIRHEQSLRDLAGPPSRLPAPMACACSDGVVAGAPPGYCGWLCVRFCKSCQDTGVVSPVSHDCSVSLSAVLFRFRAYSEPAGDASSIVCPCNKTTRPVLLKDPDNPLVWVTGEQHLVAAPVPEVFDILRGVICGRSFSGAAASASSFDNAAGRAAGFTTLFPAQLMALVHNVLRFSQLPSSLGAYATSCFKHGGAADLRVLHVDATVYGVLRALWQLYSEDLDGRPEACFAYKFSEVVSITSAPVRRLLMQYIRQATTAEGATTQLRVELEANLARSLPSHLSGPLLQAVEQSADMEPPLAGDASAAGAGGAAAGANGGGFGRGAGRGQLRGGQRGRGGGRGGAGLAAAVVAALKAAGVVGGAAAAGGAGGAGGVGGAGGAAAAAAADIGHDETHAAAVAAEFEGMAADCVVPRHIRGLAAAVLQLFATQHSTPLLSNVADPAVWLAQLRDAATPDVVGTLPALSSEFLGALWTRLPQISAVAEDVGSKSADRVCRLPFALAPLIHAMTVRALAAWGTILDRKPADLDDMTATVALSDLEMARRGLICPSNPRVLTKCHKFVDRPGAKEAEEPRACKRSTTGALNGAAHKHTINVSKRRSACINVCSCSCGKILAIFFEKNPESKRGLLEIRLASFPNASTILYDHACELLQYLLKRYPTIFVGTLVLSDRMHAKNHGFPWPNCPGTHFMTSYPSGSIKRLNGSVSEQVNSALAHAARAILFATGPMAVHILMLYMAYHNMRLNKKDGQVFFAPAAAAAAGVGAAMELDAPAEIQHVLAAAAEAEGGDGIEGEADVESLDSEADDEVAREFEAAELDNEMDPHWEGEEEDGSASIAADVLRRLGIQGAAASDASASLREED